MVSRQRTAPHRTAHTVSRAPAYPQRNAVRFLHPATERSSRPGSFGTTKVPFARADSIGAIRSIPMASADGRLRPSCGDTKQTRRHEGGHASPSRKSWPQQDLSSARTLNGDKLKVNDKRGNPIEIAAVVVWRVETPRKLRLTWRTTKTTSRRRVNPRSATWRACIPTTMAKSTKSRFAATSAKSPRRCVPNCRNVGQGGRRGG